MLIPPLQRNRFFILYFAMMMLSAYITENHYFRVIMFSHKAFLVFIVYHLCCINLATFIAYGADKRAAERGGWPGAFIAQKFFHHKTKKRSFQAMFWLMLVFEGSAVYIILRYLKLI